MWIPVSRFCILTLALEGLIVAFLGKRNSLYGSSCRTAQTPTSITFGLHQNHGKHSIQNES